MRSDKGRGGGAERMNPKHCYMEEGEREEREKEREKSES
jgi:hypothetical protein